ncbi:MAG TPA: tyrosine-type recombinase/integrase [Ktedonobacteraceae bacterium]|nr:tyrosine-type recombinase/integrase [Ktedonobacteraceae bacterium]
MTNTSAPSLPILPTTPWQMPITPQAYPDRKSRLTDEEKALMEYYVNAVGALSGLRAKNVIDQLARFEQPYADTVRLISHSRNISIGRRHLFAAMVRTGKAFWAWPKETWVEVVQTAPREVQAQGVRLWMTLLAYLFCDFLYVGASTAYGFMADIIFGKERVNTEVDKLYAPLVAIGYDKERGEYHRFRWVCSFALLANRHPESSALSASVLVNVYDLLADVASLGRIRGRRTLIRLQMSLCELEILDEPAILVSTKETASHPLALVKNDESVDPLWLAWIRAFYEQTPRYSDGMLRHTHYHMLTAGRWLKKIHPEVREPWQWDEALAAEYVTYTCQALRGDQALPSNMRYMHFQDSPQQLKPGGIRARLNATRAFFSMLQRQVYTVQGQQYPRLQLTWQPHEVFKLPDDVRAALQPNPRDIAEDAWFELIWAACTLKKEHLQAARISIYPLAYYRAASLIWVTAARRSDEIRRLQVGCVRREWVPEMRDEQGNQIEPEAELAYIRIPTNKMRGDFYVPVPLYVADAIEVWESVRPPNQRTLIDRKARKPTQYLFQYRNELMGQHFLNVSVIPLLCKLAGVNQTDVVGRITSHRARATTAAWMHKMGMAPADIGKLLGHTDPLRSLPWYLREDKHRLGRAYRKANPLERYVAAILDTNAHARQEPCVFYYLSDGPDGRPRMCGNPHFSRCIHQLMCIECEAFIDHEQAEAIEKREGTIVISVPIPLPSQMVAELNEQDEAGSDAKPKLEALSPPTLPGPAFHFNKKVPLRSPTTEAAEVQARLQQVEAQIAKKQGKVDQRSASMQALLRERAELQAHLGQQE